ncbi:hypothetical protein BCAR13_420046 [Paraburkholderia caribensis]|nr:hypothetical protein BCAR13_420046 [Paraburkholderia caribensis]
MRTGNRGSSRRSVFPRCRKRCHQPRRSFFANSSCLRWELLEQAPLVLARRSVHARILRPTAYAVGFFFAVDTGRVSLCGLGYHAIWRVRGSGAHRQPRPGIANRRPRAMRRAPRG